MDWLAQNWIWVLVAIALFALMARRGRGHHAQHAHGDGGDDMRGHDHGSTSVTTASEATDPVSGTSVPTDRALSSVYAGRVFYFESADTRQRFEADPQRYAREGTGVPVGGGEAPHRRHHGC